jgi:hypothetical protein
MPLEPQELIELAAEELRLCNSPYLNIEFSAPEAMAFLGMLQLVVKHPGLPESMFDVAMQIAEMIQCQLASCGPSVREIMLKGWSTDPDEVLS